MQLGKGKLIVWVFKTRDFKVLYLSEILRVTSLLGEKLELFKLPCDTEVSRIFKPPVYIHFVVPNNFLFFSVPWKEVEKKMELKSP